MNTGMEVLATPEVTEGTEATAAPMPQTQALFGYSVAKGTREVVMLYGFGNDTPDGVTIVAEIWARRPNGETKSQRQFYAFAGRERAQQFVNETLTALEYVGCTITPV